MIRSSNFPLAALAPFGLRARSTSASSRYSLLHVPVGSASGGGQVTGGGSTIVVQVSVGDASGGGVSEVTTGGA